MDNIQDLAESKRRRKAPSTATYKRLTTIVAFISLLEFLEVWGCGWTLLTLLSPGEFPNLWRANGTTMDPTPYHNIPNRQEFAFCVVAYLAFFLLFALSAFLLLWGNWYNKVAPFLMYQATTVFCILFTVAVAIYYIATDYESAFLFLTNPEHERSSAHLFLLLYFTRYFTVGWILKAAFMILAGQRRNQMEEEKDVDAQGEVDKAFKKIFDSEHAPSPKRDRSNQAMGRYYEEPTDSLYDREPSVPEFVQKIPRIRLSQAVDQPSSTGQNVNGYVNKGFEQDYPARSSSDGHRGKANEYDPQQRDPRYADDKVTYTKRNTKSGAEEYAFVDLRAKHRRSKSDGGYDEEQDERRSYRDDGQYLNKGYLDDSLPEPPVELRGLPRDGSNVRKNRPSSEYSFREGSFAYGPGPRGYNVPSPLARPRSVVGYPESDHPISSLRREESLVRRLSARYEDKAALRTGPPPTGGVPAIGPASIRRAPPRSVQTRQYY